MKRAETGKVRGVKDDTLIVAIDVGMEMNRGYCTTPDGRNIKPFKFDNTREGSSCAMDMAIRRKTTIVVTGFII